MPRQPKDDPLSHLLARGRIGKAQFMAPLERPPFTRPGPVAVAGQDRG
jgi:hypothetical protein